MSLLNFFVNVANVYYIYELNIVRQL